jgi:hypothetical protein
MIVTISLAFLAALVAGNGIPHFVKGITRESYPMVFSNMPVPNLIVGWLSFIIASGLAYFGKVSHYPLAAAIAAAIGLLLIGLFHAGPGAFAKK